MVQVSRRLRGGNPRFPQGNLVMRIWVEFFEPENYVGIMRDYRIMQDCVAQKNYHLFIAQIQLKQK